MKTSTDMKQRGFTIIEVVLVLAIAGLIFLMVFVALPALQRSQRDTQRRSDVSRFVSQLASYSTNNNGKIPADSSALTTFGTNYLKWNKTTPSSSEFNDPKTGEPYSFTYGVSTGNVIKDDEIYYSARAECSGENSVVNTNSRQAAVVVKLEGSGQFCESNQ